MGNDASEIDLPAGQRIGAGLFGLFLVCFGMPFTLVPFMILPEILAMGDIGPSIFLVCFTIPFLLAGLAVQYFGISAIRLAINPNSEKAQKTFSQMNSGTNDSTSTNEVLNYYISETPAEESEKKIRGEKTEQTGNFWDNIETKPPLE